MKQTYIIHKQHPHLLLFFAGWGADATPFSEYRPQASDFLVCYDYRTLSCPLPALTAGYSSISIVGWSMGVWAATRIMEQHAGLWQELCIRKSIAINGTPFPIDGQRGIPPAIFQGTLDGLTGASLNKFMRRMCADAEAYRQFLQVTPRRPVEELREELAAIAALYRQTAAQASTAFRWQQAVVGHNDRIIPPANQCRAWEEAGTPVSLTQDAHYQESMFQYYLQDLWTND